ncbi:family 16 glycosylhydrolase [Thalassomonas haliotis]|uniref:Family 16 glycosylhydrolase n=2 Tax=Thalassomonas haliotis TaxID=485448 RepID=A0ABY7VP08_9GAMM|nr:family 16 glycosylhydrolase [Thalassomonas haliotis]
MKISKTAQGIACSVALLTTHNAIAAWADFSSNDIAIVQSQPVFDRINRVYTVQLEISNFSSAAIKGPLRVLIENASIALSNQSGETDSGIPYVELAKRQLGVNETTTLAVNFALERKALSFEASLQSDNSPAANWNLVWSDEFDGNSLDLSKWQHEVNCWGGGNGEQQCYTDRVENTVVADGKLNIIARREDFTGPDNVDGNLGSVTTLPYTSARLRTMNQGDWKYGRFEVKAKLPHGQGSWSGIWMLPTDWVFGGWAASGEIDIVEAVNLKTQSDEEGAAAGELEARVHGTLHYGKAWPENVYSGTEYKLPGGVNPADDYHVYAVEWQEGEIRWYVDDVHYATQRESGWYSQYIDNDGDLVNAPGSAPYDQAFHMLLNLAVGGAWAGNVNDTGIDESAFPQTLAIDYVRVYECSVSPDTGAGCATVAEDAELVEGHQPPQLPDPVDNFGQGAVFDLYIDNLYKGLAFNSYNPDGAISYQEVAVDGRGTVLQISKTGATGNLYFEYSPRVNLGLWQEYGELVFDVKVSSQAENSELLVKLDSGWPAVSDYAVPVGALNEWQQVRIAVAELLAGGNRFSPGNFADISDIINPLVIEPTGTMELQLDNVRFEYNLAHVDSAVIFDDNLHAPFDYLQYVGSGSVDTELVDSGDAEHGDVARMSFNTDEAVVFFQGKQDKSGTPLQLDISEFSTVEFDVKVLADPRETRDFMIKMDCGNPCGSGDYPIAAPPIGVWTSYQIAIADLVNHGGSSLDVTKVDTPLVIFPAWGNQQGVVMQVDNVRLSKDADVELPPVPPSPVVVTGGLALYQEQLEQNWALWDCCANAAISEVVDSHQGKVVNVDFFGASGTVSGLIAEAEHDLTAISQGTLEFDFKLVDAALDSSAQILLKVEAKNGSAAQLELAASVEGQAPVLGNWQHFTFKLADLAALGLALSEVDKVLIFPEWGKARGAVYQLDNVKLLP